MRFQEKLHEYSKEEIWAEYCGFLTLSTEEFMAIQKRLLTEQMELWCNSALGQSILKGKVPTTIEEFAHRAVPWFAWKAKSGHNLRM